MTLCCNFGTLKHDLEKKKQVVLFVGAGINATSDPAIDMSWNALMNSLFYDALRFLSIEKDIPAIELDIIRQGLDRNSLDNQCQNFKDLLKIKETLDYEFTPQIKASIVKEILGDNYILDIQKFLYSQCNKRLIKQKFQEAYTLKNKTKGNSTYPFYSLYTMARMVILYPYVKAIVSYNYDNYLKEAIQILLKDKEEYFTQDELTRINKRNFTIQDISGFTYTQEMTNDILSIYHVHGYIQPPSESFITDNNQIVLSMDEYYESEKNVYSWHTATQLHFLSHYTCILNGMSLTDPTPQRMLYHVKRSGNEDKIYFLTASGNSNMQDRCHSNAYRSIRTVKNVYHAKCGLDVIYNQEGYLQLYKELNNIIDNLNI